MTTATEIVTPASVSTATRNAALAEQTARTRMLYPWSILTDGGLQQVSLKRSTLLGKSADGLLCKSWVGKFRTVVRKSTGGLTL